MADSEQDPSSPEPSRRRVRRLLAVAGALVLVWLLIAGYQLFTAARSAQSGLDLVERIGRLATDDLGDFVGTVGGEEDDVAEEDAPELLSSAASEFGDAERRIASPIVAPLRLLPVVGRQLRSVDSLARSARITAEAGAVAFEALDAELEGTAQTPEQRLDSVRTTEATLVELRDTIEGLDLGPTEKLIPPLARARNRFYDDYTVTMQTLDEAIAASTGVRSVLEGPSRYLVLAANNAEMRAGSGMFLQIGELTVENGRFEVSEFLPARDLVLAEPGTELDRDMSNLWGWASPDRDFRNVNLTPRFELSAEMAADMWQASGRGQVDGVIMVDVLGLAELMDVTGPVQVATDRGEAEISADNIVEDLMLGQYQDFVDERDERTDRLGAVARAVLDAFDTRSWSASELLAAIDNSGSSRHIMAWSRLPVQQEAWRALGASGELAHDTLMVSVLNRGGNKLDQFLEVAADISTRASDEGTRVKVDVTLYNSAPRALPYYVEGPHPFSGLSQGDYLGLLSLTLPSGAGNIDVLGGDELIVGQDGSSRVAVTEVLLPLGESAAYSFEFDLPETWNKLQVLPSARVPVVEWGGDLKGWPEDAPREFTLSSG